MDKEGSLILASSVYYIIKTERGKRKHMQCIIKRLNKSHAELNLTWKQQDEFNKYYVFQQ